MNRRQNSRSREKSSEDRQTEGDDNQREVPNLKHPPALLHLYRMEKGSGRQPGHEGGILHRIPCPVTAPPKNMIGPPSTHEIAGRQKEPSDDGPAAGGDNPCLIDFAANQGGHSEGVGDRESDEAGVKKRRMGHHVGVFEQRIETAAVRRHRRDRLERIGNEGDDAKKEGGDNGKDHEHPRHRLSLTVAVDPGHQSGEDNENPFPEQQRAFQRTPQTGDAIVDRRRARGIEGDITDREIRGHKCVDQGSGRQRDQYELSQNGGAGESRVALVIAPRAENRADDSPGREQ